MTTSRVADATDARILHELQRDPDATNLAIAGRTGLSRNTVRARLERYRRIGALRGHDRRIDPTFLGYPLRAFIFVEVQQRRLADVARALAAIPEVVEVSGISGPTDLVTQVVARNADHLYEVAGRVLDVDGVIRTNTGLVMRNLIDYRLTQLLP